MHLRALSQIRLYLVDKYDIHMDIHNNIVTYLESGASYLQYTSYMATGGTNSKF